MFNKEDILKKTSNEILKMFSDFNIKLKLHEAVEGPNTLYFTFKMINRIRMKDFQGYLKDLQYALGTKEIVVQAPVSNESLISIEVAQKKKQLYKWEDIVNLKEYKNREILEVPLGYTYRNELMFVDIKEQPHILIAGTTGSGKSILIHNWLCSIISKYEPNEIRLILVDPKRVELNQYSGIQHLLTDIIQKPEYAISALKWTIAEMENRYKLLAKEKVMNIAAYNKIKNIEKIPYILFIVDELADLMLFAKKDAEELITRITQLARATGIHLILTTQRPATDVLTGFIKANIPSRIAFFTASSHDSKVILDLPGAEKLMGNGDAFFLPPTEAHPRRIQTLYISDKNINTVIDQVINKYGKQEVEKFERYADPNDINNEPLFNKALEIVSRAGVASASLIQRQLSIGYARAARILDLLEQAGYIGPAVGSKPRDVISKKKI